MVHMSRDTFRMKIKSRSGLSEGPQAHVLRTRISTMPHYWLRRGPGLTGYYDLAVWLPLALEVSGLRRGGRCSSKRSSHDLGYS